MIDTNSALFWVIPDEVNWIQYLAWRLRYGAIVAVMAPGLHMLHTNLLVAIHQMMLQLLLLQATTFHSEKRYNVLHTWWFWPFSKVTSTLCPIVGHNGEELGSDPVPYAMILTSAILYPCFPNVHTKALVFDSFI